MFEIVIFIDKKTLNMIFSKTKQRLLSLLRASFVAVRIGTRSDRIQHPVVVDQSIILVLGMRVQLVLLGVPDNVMGLDNALPSRFAEGSL